MLIHLALLVMIAVIISGIAKDTCTFDHRAMCGNVTPLPLGRNDMEKLTRRWYIYQSTHLDSGNGTPGNCGMFDSTKRCKCTLSDIFFASHTVFHNQFSFNTEERRRNTHLYSGRLIDPTCNVYTIQYSFLGKTVLTDVGTDDHQTYIVSVQCASAEDIRKPPCCYTVEGSIRSWNENKGLLVYSPHYSCLAVESPHNILISNLNNKFMISFKIAQQLEQNTNLFINDFGTRGVWIWTSEVKPSKDTLHQIDLTLKANFITEPLYEIDQSDCKRIYPASAYTVDSKYYTG